MIKNAVMFSFLKNHPGSIIPSQRIARLVAERLKLKIYWDEPIQEKRIDVLFIVNGAYAFSESLQALGEAVLRAGRIVWIQNDYTIIPPINDGKAETPFRRAFVERRERGKSHLEYWTTCEKESRLTPLSSYVNWNALTWAPRNPSWIKAKRREGHKDLLYYGSYRHASGHSSREKYFDRYLSIDDKSMPISISSPGRGDKPNEKFVTRFPHATHTGKIKGDFHEEIASHGSGLYIEDQRSHREFHSPANRLYEMASVGLPMIFQIESIAMLKKAGMDFSEWMALTSEKVLELHKDRHAIHIDQQHLMRKIDHIGMMGEQFATAIKKLEADCK